METSSAHHDSLDPANPANFKNKMNVPSRDGLLGLLEASAGPVELVARRERVEVAPGTETEMLVYRAERGGRVWLNPAFLVKTGDGFSEPRQRARRGHDHPLARSAPALAAGAELRAAMHLNVAEKSA